VGVVTSFLKTQRQLEIKVTALLQSEHTVLVSPSPNTTGLCIYRQPRFLAEWARKPSLHTDRH